MQRLFDAIPRNLLRNQQAYVLVFDLCDRESFADLPNWLSSIRDVSHRDTPIFVVGNKSDRTDRTVQTDEGKAFAQAYKTTYFESSSHTGANVQALFESVIEQASRQTAHQSRDGRFEASNRLTRRDVNPDQDTNCFKRLCNWLSNIF